MTHGELQALFEAYVPWNEQERNDRELALQAFRCFECAGHGTNSVGDRPITGSYRQV